MSRSFEARGKFGCTSRTVSYAWELVSVYMRYSQRTDLMPPCLVYVLYPRVTYLLACFGVVVC